MAKQTKQQIIDDLKVSLDELKDAIDQKDVYIKSVKQKLNNIVSKRSPFAESRSLEELVDKLIAMFRSAENDIRMLNLEVSMLRALEKKIWRLAHDVTVYPHIEGSPESCDVPDMFIDKFRPYEK